MREVKAGDIWVMGEQAYHAQSDITGKQIMLRPILLPEQLDATARLIYRDGKEVTIGA